MVSQPLEAKKNILGYALKERIGSGGFGEVWSAVAPGGLMKAVKIVYGYHDEKRAQAELKALDRVKEVRHPFLLSLERIEVHEGQLIVVSELADKSMADLFNEYAIKGEAGIPREDLLKYMRSVADALDYLSDEHGLQHLDIKPENLLMVSGHVKVADFGLIKDLQDASQSLMSGMTPAYAAPELFDGRPGKKSDQYSLAIVYQEMLTSIRPFPGTTPAQLAAQHMHGKPNLRPLPQSDQPVLAKALAKDPSVRYESCRAMAEELSNRKLSTKKSVRRMQPTRVKADSDSHTISNDQCDATALISSAGLPFQVSEIETLDPPECDAESAKLQPVLIVGVGATANRAVKRLKQQFIARHNSMDEIPAIRVVCIDTDRNDISELCMSRDGSSMTSEETVQTPLHKPEVYRDRASSHFSWLSRRWIYNIPRSLQTEALRPLGRLAFVEHFDSICSSISGALDQITAKENIATTAEALDIDPGDQQPRVFIVTSISGGVGSGMTLDLAYTIKLLMAEHGLETNTVSGILLHSSYQRTRDPGLAAANAFAFLTELRHFVENGYPGESTVGIPEFEDESPFDFTYYNELGNDLSQTEYDAKLNSIAEYMYLSTTSKCSEFFSQCRELEKDIEHYSLRTFGLSNSGPGNLKMGAHSVNHVAHAMVQRWINGPSVSNFDAQQFVADKATKLALTTDQVLDMVTAQGKDVVDIEAIAVGAEGIALGGSSDRLANLAAYWDGALGCPPSRRDSSHVDSEVCLQMEELLGTQASFLGDQVATSVIALLETEKLDLGKAKMALESWGSQLQGSSDQVDRATVMCDEQATLQLTALQALSIDRVRSKPDERKKFDEILKRYCQLRFEEFVLRFAKHFYRGVQHGLGAAEKQVKKYLNELSNVAQRFSLENEMPEEIDSDLDFSLDQLLSDSVQQDIELHVDRAEIQIFESLATEFGGYVEMLNDSTCIKNRLPNEVAAAAQRVLADAYKKVSLEKVIARNNVGAEQVVKWLTDKVRQARPLVNDCGGASRILLGVPELSSGSILPELLSRQFNLNVKTINGTRGSFAICFEAEGVSLANVAYRLLQSRPDAVELVQRIQTRNDVNWSSLNDLL